MYTYAVKAQWKRSISYLLYAAEIAGDFKRLLEDAEDWDFTMKKHSIMAFFGPSVTFCFGLDSRVTVPESLLSNLPIGGITFSSFTDSAYVTLGGPTPSEAVAFSPPQRRGCAAMRPFGRPVAWQPSRVAARPAPSSYP
ncbi:hypothetical protein M5K25_018747 [Dendrobium thyrsiflorum]|uniref:Uncharacterized protein n=1 Tax=Dendrobium thyrsiflorum TaxID=117978 RepID=A0ABD0UJZ4_DENTH